MSVHGVDSSRMPTKASEPFVGVLIRLILLLVRFLLGLFMGTDFVYTLTR